MKKYITTLPLNRYNPINYYYVNDELAFENKTCFPILLLLKETVEENEEVELLILVNKENETSKENRQHFIDELEAANFNFKVNYKFIDVGVAESSQTQLNTFITLTEFFNDNDKGYCDITFGTKGLLLITLNAITYCMKQCENFKLIRMVYGYLDHQKDPLVGYYTDFTSSFYINKIVEDIPKDKLEELKPMISSLIGE